MGSSPTLWSLGPSYLWWHKSRASLLSLPSTHDVAGSLHREVRNRLGLSYHPHRTQSIVRGGWYPNWCPVSGDIVHVLHLVTCLHWREVKILFQPISHHESLLFIISNVNYVLNAFAVKVKAFKENISFIKKFHSFRPRNV